MKKDTPNIDAYAEVLKWQKDMQAQRIHLTKNVLTSHLEQISEVCIERCVCFEHKFNFVQNSSSFSFISYSFDTDK